jgi:hypothetical protein
MNISISLKEILDKGLWDNFCILKGWNVWCINEGLASDDEIVTLSIDEYKKIGG